MYVKQALGVDYTAQLGTKTGSDTVTFSGGTGTGSGTSSVKDAAKGILTGALDIFKSGEQAKGAEKAYASINQQAVPVKKTPAWVMPVAIGAGALVLVLALRK